MILRVSNINICLFRVACKQLGFPDAFAWSTTSANRRVFLSRSRRVIRNDVVCLGNETRLTQCRHFTSPSYDFCTDQVFIHCLCADCNDYSAYIRIVTTLLAASTDFHNDWSLLYYCVLCLQKLNRTERILVSKGNLYAYTDVENC